MDNTAEGNCWSPQYEALMAKWRKECAIQMWLQQASHQYYTRLDNWFSYPSIVLSTIISIGIFASFAECADHALLNYGMGFLALSSAALTGINKQMMSAERAAEHRTHAQEYQVLVRHIDYVLNLTCTDRPPALDTLSELRGRLDTLTQHQHHPPPHIVRAYERTHRGIERSMFKDLEDEAMVTRGALSDTRYVRQITQLKQDEAAAAAAAAAALSPV
jgi:hypothetical protein